MSAVQSSGSGTESQAAGTPTGLQASSVLSQDFFWTSDVLVALPARPGASMLSPFLNPVLGNRIEAFFIDAADGNLQHLFADPTSSTGWSVEELFGGVQASEVHAVPTADGHVWLVWLDAQEIYFASQQSDGQTWVVQGDPIPSLLLPTSFGVTHVASAPTVLTPRLSALGQEYATTPALLIGSCDEPDSEQWTWTTWGGGLSEAGAGLLCALGTNWFTYLQENPWVIFAGELSWSGGELSQATLDSQQPTISQFVGSTDAGAQGTSTFFAVVDGALAAYTNVGADSAMSQVALTSGTPVVSACQTLDGSSGAVSLFCVDSSGCLSVILQGDPSADPAQWSPAIPLDTGIKAVWANPAPSAAPLLFSMVASTGGLQIHLQDPDSGIWMVRPVTTSPTAGQTPPDTSRYRTEVTVTDANGAPVAGATVGVSAATATEIAVGTHCYLLDGTTPASLTTDATGKVTVASIAKNLSPPVLTFTCGDLDPLSVNCAQAVQDYFGGSGTALPQQGGALDGSALQNATSDGTMPVFPPSVWNFVSPTDAATAISSLVNPPSTTTTDATHSALLGFELDKRDRSNPKLTLFYDQELLDDALGKLPVEASVGSWFEHLGESVWHGIETGASNVVHAVVSVADIAIVTIEDEVTSIEQTIQSDLEDVLQGVTAMFNWLEAEIDNVIDWLKALFDFDDIWATKVAFDEALVQLPSWWNTISNTWSNDLVNNFFEPLQNSVNSWFMGIEGTVGGIGGLQSYQTFGGQPTTTPAAGNMSAQDVGGNVHANWFHNQMTSSSTTIALQSGASPAPDTLVSALKDAETNISNSAMTLFHALFPNSAASDLQDVTLVEFLAAFDDLADAGLDIADALAQGLLGMANDMVEGLAEVMGTPLDVGFITTVYGWVADLAGQPVPDGHPTLGDLVTLAAAFPCTVLYKLVNDNTAPFPLTQPDAGLDESLSAAEVIGMMGDIVSGVATLFTLWQDVANASGEGLDLEWLEVFNNGLLALNIILSYPDLYLQPQPLRLGVTASAASTGGLALYIGYWVARYYDDQSGTEQAWSTVKTLATTVIGFARLVAAIVSWADASESNLAGAADVVGNIGGATDYLNLPVLAEIPDILWIKTGIDGVSGFGGTVLGVLAIGDQ